MQSARRFSHSPESSRSWDIQNLSLDYGGRAAARSSCVANHRISEKERELIKLPLRTGANRRRLKSGELWVVNLLTAVALVCGGCEKTSQPETISSGDLADPTRAQPKLQTMKLWVGPEELNVELALTPEQQRIGMMLRTNLAEDAGMFFPLPVTQRASFWMKNCPIPLSAAYIDPEGLIVEIHDLKPHNTNSVVATSHNIRFVLETSHGWFDRHHVKPGMLVRSERGTLMETFFGKGR